MEGKKKEHLRDFVLPIMGIGIPFTLIVEAIILRVLEIFGVVRVLIW